MPTSADYTPLISTPPEEAAPGTFGAAQPTAYLPQGVTQNFARLATGGSHPLRTDFEHLVAICEQTRRDRTILNDEWMAIDNMLRLVHDDGRRYRGDANNYVPVYLKNRQTQVTGLSRGLFPSQDYLSVTDMRPGGSLDDAKAIETYLKWEFEEHAKLPRTIKKALGPYADYGIMVLKHQFNKTRRTEGRRRAPTEAEVVQAMAGTLPDVQPRDYSGLMVTARSPYNWYIYPTNIDCIDEAQAIFEDVKVSRAYIEGMGYAREWENTQEALANYRVPEHDANEQHIADASGTATDGSTSLQGNPLAERFTVTEVWCAMRLPPAAYLPGEDPRLPVPTRVVYAGTTPMVIMRNPLYSQRPPYEVSVQNAQPGHFYGFGSGRIIKNLQYLVNDWMNQTTDVGRYGLNPVVKANPGLLAAPLKPIKPGVVWYMTDPKGVEFDRPPIEQVQFGVQMLQMVTGMAMDFGGAPPILQGTSAGKGARTATGSQILQRNAMMPLQDVVEDVERDVMVGLMKAAFMYGMQHRTQQFQAMVAGRPMPIPPQAFLIDPAFRWNASNQAVNQQMRGEQAVAFLQAALNPAVLTLLQTQGKTINPIPVLKRSYSDGMGFPDFDQVVVDLPAMPMMPGMPPGAPGALAEQGGSPTSALANQGEGEVEPAPGEGEDFGAVRAGADSMAAAFGPQGG